MFGKQFGMISLKSIIISPWINLRRKQREHPMVVFSMPWFLNHGYQQNPAKSAGRKLSSSRFLRRNQWHKRKITAAYPKIYSYLHWPNKELKTLRGKFLKPWSLSTWPLRPVGSYPHRHPHRSPPRFVQVTSRESGHDPMKCITWAGRSFQQRARHEWNIFQWTVESFRNLSIWRLAHWHGKMRCGFVWK